MSERKRFKKVVEYKDLDMQTTYFYTCGMFTLFIIGLILWLITVNTDYDKHFFPIGVIFISFALCLVLPYIFQIRVENEYYEELKR